MALRTLHLCQFQFKDQDIRRVGSVIDGGTSLSGISDTVENDGGGYWRADYTNGTTRDAAGGLAWRTVGEVLNGGAFAVNVLLCEALFAPQRAAVHIPRGVGPLTDGSEYSPTSSYIAAVAPLRATSIVIAGDAYARPIRPGMLFSINHAAWGWRTYRIMTLTSDGTATFRPPLRQAIPAGTPIEFDYPRCQMHLAPGTQISNATNIGRFGTCSLALVEDMRKPANLPDIAVIETESGLAITTEG